MRNPVAILMIGIIVASIAGGTWLFFTNRNAALDQAALPTTTPTASPLPASNTGAAFRFIDPKKSAHYETNTPAHGALLPGVPVDVVIDFNFDLSQGSTITISKEGKDYGIGATIIDDNRLTMRRSMDTNAPDGVYTVIYKACWPDKTCHDGLFQFAIDRSRAQNMADLTGKTEVAIDMDGLAFSQASIRINKGTKVTWTNREENEHYINADSHPAHTQVPELNSKALKLGDSYSYTFEQPGVYLYHCSAHAGIMTGTILVE